MPLLQPDLVQRLTAALLHIVQTLPATAFPRSQVGNGSGTHLYAYLSICAVISGNTICIEMADVVLRCGSGFTAPWEN